MSVVIDIRTGTDPNCFEGKCVGGPYADQHHAYFKSKMPVFQEMKGYIGQYLFIAGAWRWSPLDIGH